MSDYLYHHNAITHWAYPTSEETGTDHHRLCPKRASRFLNASPAEIVFGANMTTLTFHLARALSRDYERNDEILVTELDHHANIARGGRWKRVRREGAHGENDSVKPAGWIGRIFPGN